jgi:hypothetical protein
MTHFLGSCILQTSKPGCHHNLTPSGQAANYARLYALRAAMWHVDAVLPHVEAATPAALQVKV